MALSHDSGICVFCGSRPNETLDHTPSRNLFPKPAPSNLITVPSCRECNISFSQDEEYFRMTLVYSQYGEKAPDSIRESIGRSLDRETSRLFDLLVDALKVEAGTDEIEIVIDRKRIERVCRFKW